MSGFFGVFSPSGNIDRHAFHQMQRTIQTDGYEELETHLDENIAMGHLMLRVTPESNYDKQPLKSSCGRYLLVGHFRLDYRDELGDKLGLTQKELDLTPDSLLVMLAYQKWADHCVQHIEGDWAFVIYDYAINQLNCYKDFYGVSSLFYGDYKGSFYFSTVSSIFQKIAGKIFEVDLNHLYRLSFIEIGIEKNKTLFQGIYALSPCSRLIVSQELKITITQHSTIESIRRINFKKEIDYILQFHSLFAASIKSRLRGLKKVGILQSSGLDSNAILFFTANEMKYSDKVVNTYTSTNAYIDKLPFKIHQYISDDFLFRQSLNYYDNVNATFLDFRDNSFKNDFENSLRDYDNPLVTKSKFWLRGLLRTAKEDKVQLIFTGQLGNFTITWNAPNIILNYFLKFELKIFIKEFLAVKKVTNLSVFRLIWLVVLKPICKWFFEYFEKILGIKISKVEKSSIFSRRVTRFINLRKEMSNPAFFSNLISTLMSSKLRKNLLIHNAHVTGGRWYYEGFNCGLLASDPTIDKQLTFFLLSIPELLFNKAGRQKYLFRKMMEGKIYKPILENPYTIEQSFDLRYRILSDSFFYDFIEMLEKDVNIQSSVNVKALKSSYALLQSLESNVRANLEAIKFIKNISIVYLYVSYVRNGEYNSGD